MQPENQTSSPETVAQSILDLLALYGIRYMFLTTGTEWAPLQDGLSKMLAQERVDQIVPLTVPHEVVSTGMALGYAMKTGKPACVGVHVNVGTANALGNMMTATRARVPMLLLAGKTPITDLISIGGRDNQVHWGQDFYDQSALVRESARWEYEMKRTENIPQVVARAFKMMKSSPQGPVYLTFTRELLMQQAGNMRLPRMSAADGVPISAVSLELVQNVLGKLARATNPLIITGALGRNAEAVGDLVTICNRLAVPVTEAVRQCMNYPTNDPMHLGFNPTDMARHSDLVLVIDCMVPWISEEPIHESTEVIQIDEDPTFSEIPMWNFPVDHQIKADSATFLKSMRHLLVSGDYGAERARIDERRQRVIQAHDSWKKRSKEFALSRCKDKPIDFGWLSFEINNTLVGRYEDLIIVNEFPLDMNQVEITKPLSYFGSTSSGYLGRSLGQAIGVKVASPSSLVVATVGDGVYIFSAPEAAHWVSNTYDIPFLTIIFNNQGWETEKKPIEKFYPHGWSERSNKYVGVKLDPPGDYSKIVGAFGGYGERVTEPEDVSGALNRAVKFMMQSGKQAVLDVICKNV
jgi:acetolactate synthase-1/2/3 large subunit